MSSAKTFLRSANIFKKKAAVVVDECGVCDRPSGLVVCVSCKGEFKGRIKTTCIKHPRVLYISDFTKCPTCKRENTLKDASATVKKSNDMSECVCERRNTKLYCMNCGWFTTGGRIRKICPAHPKTIFVHDLDSQCCPTCKDSSLEELAD